MEPGAAVHDFDFYMGTWRVHNRRLTKRLAGSDEWEEFEGTSHAWPILGGAGNIDDNVVDLPNGQYRAISLRTYDPVADQWSIWWLDGRSPGRLDPPVVGGFQGRDRHVHRAGHLRRPADPRAFPVVGHHGDDVPLGAGLLDGRRRDVGGQLDHGVDEDRVAGLPPRPDTRHNPNVKTVAARNPRRLTRVEAQSLTRSRLIDAAAEVFCEEGFLQSSLADVADRAGYTIGAVYSNFSSKDDLLFAVMRDRLRRVEAALAAALPADGGAAPGSSESVDGRIARELDRLAAAEDAVPPGWWRLLFEFRVHAAADPVAWAELAESERRCREIIAGSHRTIRGICRGRPAALGDRARRADVSPHRWAAGCLRRGPQQPDLRAGPAAGRRSLHRDIAAGPDGLSPASCGLHEPSATDWCCDGLGRNGCRGQELREGTRVRQMREMTAAGPDERSSVGQVRLQPCRLFGGRILSDKRRDRHAGLLERGRSLVHPGLQLGGRSIEEVLPIAEDDILSWPARHLDE